MLLNSAKNSRTVLCNGAERGKGACIHRITDQLFSARALLWCGVLFVGSCVGLGLYTFLYADGMAYFSDDPQACANCHVMQPHYAAWSKSSHHTVAVCNDCHTPHTSVVQKLLVKAVNGFHHSLAFTTGRFHEPILITDFNQAVTESSCRYCHRDVVDAIDTLPRSRDAIACVRCHAEVGHMY